MLRCAETADRIRKVFRGSSGSSTSKKMIDKNAIAVGATTGIKQPVAPPEILGLSSPKSQPKPQTGRPKQKKTLWIQEQFGKEGLTPSEICDKWDEMKESERKKIDPENFHPFISPNLKDETVRNNTRKKALDRIEKHRPKKKK